MDLVTLRTYRNPVDAEVAKTKLESAGIPAHLIDENLAAIYSGVVGGVRVQVAQSDLELARQVLREDHSADLASIPENQTSAAREEAPPEGLEETLEAELRVYEPRTYLRAIMVVVAGLAVLYYVWLQIHSE